MNEVTKRRVVGAGVLAGLLLIFSSLFLKHGEETGPVLEQPSDLADVRNYAIDVPDVPEQPPEQILSEGPPIGTLLPVPEPSPTPAKPAGEPRKAKTPATTAQPGPAEPRPPAVPDEGWSVQVGSFASRDNAEGMLKRLKDKGYPVFIYRNASENPPLFRVRVGPYLEQGKARAESERLREELRVDVKIVSNG